MGWLTDLLVALLGLFLVLDGVAHLTHYRYGETFSAFCWHLEDRWPWMRAVFGVLIAVLWLHIVLHRTKT